MATEVFNNIGESEIYSQNPNFYRKKSEGNEGLTISDEVETITKPISDTKKEFFDKMQDDSLTIDTCSKLNHDWKKK